MTNILKKAAAVTAFAVAFGGSLVLAPPIIDNALALDNPGPADDERPHRKLPGELIEARIAFLETALHITGAQTKTWEAFADVLRKQAEERDAMITAGRAYRDTKFTAIQRLEQRQKELTRDAADTGELLAVATPLYAALSDDQKQTADELLEGHFADWHDRSGWPPADGPHHGPVRPE